MAPHPVTVFPSSNILYRLQYSFAADFDFMIQNMKKYNVVVNDSVVVCMIRSDDQLSRKHKSVIKDECCKIQRSYKRNFTLSEEISSFVFRWTWIVVNLLSKVKYRFCLKRNC